MIIHCIFALLWPPNIRYTHLHGLTCHNVMLLFYQSQHSKFDLKKISGQYSLSPYHVLLFYTFSNASKLFVSNDKTSRAIATYTCKIR